MAVVLRAVIMLSVLVGLPAAWVYYGPLPPQAQSVIDRFVGQAKSTLGWEDTQLADPNVVNAPFFDPAVTPASNTEPEYSPQDFPEPNVAQLTPPNQSMVATARETPATTPTASSPSLEEQLTPLLQQLQAQGASEYKLEKWGHQGSHYRFCCDMPLPFNPSATQQFEAVHPEPSLAIQQVLTEITTWKTARSGQTQLR